MVLVHINTARAYNALVEDDPRYRILLPDDPCCANCETPAPIGDRAFFLAGWYRSGKVCCCRRCWQTLSSAEIQALAEENK